MHAARFALKSLLKSRDNLLVMSALLTLMALSARIESAIAQNSVIEVPPLSPAPPAAGGPTLDALIKDFKPGQGPIVVPPISFVDVNAGRFGKLEIDLTDGQFLDAAVEKMHILAKDLDVKEGVLKSLEIAIHEGHLQDFIFDQMKIITEGDLKFDPGILLNHRILQFSEPAQAKVTATISQASLNRFLNSPITLQRLSVKAGGKVAAIASLIGVNNANLGLNIGSANLSLKKKNRITIEFQSALGLGQVGLPLNGAIEGTLALTDGRLDVFEPHLITAGQELPPELSAMVVKKIGGISASTQKSEDMRFRFTDLKVVANKQIQLSGTAQISRLRFGQSH